MSAPEGSQIVGPETFIITNAFDSNDSNSTGGNNEVEIILSDSKLDNQGEDNPVSSMGDDLLSSSGNVNTIISEHEC
eukprot:7270101-Ditylum_brightwellii.AAC.1